MNKRVCGGLLMCGLVLGGASGWAAARPDVNEEESKVPAYTLPEALVTAAGARVVDSKGWLQVRRPEVLAMFEEHVYGRSPRSGAAPLFEVLETDGKALGGRAVRKQVAVWLTGRREGPRMDLLVYTPAAAEGPVPVFLGLNFGGNQTVELDRGIRLARTWVRNDPAMGITNNMANEASRGSQASRWQVLKLVERGFGVATAYYGDIEPDFDGGWRQGLRAAMSPAGTNAVFGPTEWGAIGAWAFGLSRAVDYLEQDKAIDAKRIVVIGHSRLGKTALWAGAQDERIAMVISNDSGEGGASIARRKFGERTQHLVKNFPHWFCGKYREYAGREEALPVDAHLLIALCAPRPLYVASATQDLWADPKGEFLAVKHAEPVYALFGKKGLGAAEPPAANHPIGDALGYHVREGGHDITAYDWDQYLDFADRHLRAGELAR